MQALFLEDKSSKLATQVKSRKAYLKAVAVDPASAMAELIALEYFVGVTASAKVKEVQPFARSLKLTACPVASLTAL